MNSSCPLLLVCATHCFHHQPEGQQAAETETRFQPPAYEQALESGQTGGSIERTNVGE
jgi:hypothetical protein